ncbi:MAG: type II toxin-antitoxin system RelE/ParE family toxin [Acidobacteria bacterium]|nr:type II toxin-antitoxin system RelE/ParE family toxin [Acidobacteriota bacterium]
MRVELHPDALLEVRAAALWYDERQTGLGDRFIDRLSELFDRLVTAPAAYPVWPGTGGSRTPIRRAVAEQFPSVVAFEAHDDHVRILAVAHGRRRPLYWLARAGEPG